LDYAIHQIFTGLNIGGKISYHEL